MIPYNSFEFNGINSMDNGVYISGNAVFNAPERDVEMIVIPGRNGEFIRDNGRFNNIEVTYPCGMFGDNDFTFRTKLRQFRNMLAGQTGYQRLVDTYNPDEYRLAVFKDAVEVEPAALNTAGQFEVVFNCKPQRFLTSGETKTAVASGSTVTNPTLFDAQPMIMTKGYGALTLNGYEINITDDRLGRVLLADSTTNRVVTFDGTLFDEGDEITVDMAQLEFIPDREELPSVATITNIDLLSQTGSGVISIDVSGWYSAVAVAYFGCEFEYGTPKNYDSTYTLEITFSNGITLTEELTARFRYDGDETVRYSDAMSPGYFRSNGVKTAGMYGVSTKTAIGNPTYIDCELGEVYKIESGSYISLNHLTDLGSNLPVLSPGENEITFDNTFTSVEIIPHWWVV